MSYLHKYFSKVLDAVLQIAIHPVFNLDVPIGTYIVSDYELS